jgi:parallel beta-helix repeat protein
LSGRVKALARIKAGLVSGIWVLLLLVAVFGVVSNVPVVKGDSGTIYIRADGSIDPPDAPISTVDNVTYTFTGNVNDALVVQRSNIVIDGNGHTVQGTGAQYSAGISLYGKTNVTIKSMKIRAFSWGIDLDGSSNNTIVANTITEYGWDGMRFFESTNNTVTGNVITDHDTGISFQRCSKNTVSRNYITDNKLGIELYDPSNNNTISGNIIANNSAGTYGGGILLHGSYNTIFGNNITNNYCGIGLDVVYTWASDNFIYHNNFLNNTDQVNFGGSLNTWDDGYPSGGNYWSDYTGVDEFRGPYQNETSNDGIGDMPYVINENNTDHYPLMQPLPVLAPPVPSAPTEVKVGVKVGDWIKIDYTITGWLAGTPYPLWLKVGFLSVEETTATVQVTMRMSNGTEQSETVPVDVVSGGQAFGLSGFVIPANSTIGDSINFGGFGFTSTSTIEGETTRTYAGASRTVVYASISQLGIQLTYYWDKQTGVMVEASTTSGTMSATGKATETNIWQAAPGIPIDPIILTVLIAIVIVIVMAIFLERRKKKPTEA